MIQYIRESCGLFSIHKGIVNDNTQEAHWNTWTQRSPCCAIKENIIMFT